MDSVASECEISMLFGRAWKYDLGQGLVGKTQQGFISTRLVDGDDYFHNLLKRSRTGMLRVI